MAEKQQSWTHGSGFRAPAAVLTEHQPLALPRQFTTICKESKTIFWPPPGTRHQAHTQYTYKHAG